MFLFCSRGLLLFTPHSVRPMATSQPTPADLFGDVEVENTNLESHRSKQSLTQYGYRHDIFLEKFGAPVTSPRSGPVNQGYLARALAMENSFEKALIKLSMTRERFQVLSCGAGFDTTYLRLKNAGILTDLCDYFEVDYPNVTRQKSNSIWTRRMVINLCLQGSEDNLVRVDSAGNLRIHNYTVIGCDLSRTDMLQDLLVLFGFDFQLPTVVLCECSLTYVPVQKASLLYRWINVALPKVHLIVYEQIVPHDRFGTIMRRHFTQRSSPLLNIDPFPTLHDQERRFLSLGFAHVQSVPLSDVIFWHYGESEKRRRKRLESQFDEFEELFMKCAHYSVAESCSGPKAEFLLLKSSSPSSQPNRALSGPLIRPCHPSFQRYGHFMVLHNQELYVLGGSSVLSGRDHILAQFDLSDPCKGPVRRTVLDTHCSTFSGFCFSHQNPLKVFCFGGRSSPKDSSDRLFEICLNDFEQREILPKSTQSFWPEPRWKHSIDLVHGDLVLIGGRNLQKQFSEVLSFSLTSRNWDQIGKLPNSIFAHSSCVHKSKLIVSGGIDNNEQISASIHEIDITSDKCVKTYKVPGLLARFGHSSFIYKSKLILFGGVSNLIEPGLAVIDLDNLMISKEYQMDIPRTIGNYNYGSILQENRVLVFGGGGNCFSFGMHIGSQILEINLDYYCH